MPILSTIAVGCSLTLAQAQAMVLSTPTVVSAQAHGAKPFFEWIGRAPNGWSFTVNSRIRCKTDNPCSSLIGHFAVSRTGQVEDLDAIEGSGTLVKASSLIQMRSKFCRTRVSHPDDR